MNSRSTPAEQRRARIVLAALVVCVIGVHACLIGYGTFANVDESYALALGQRLLEGNKLYVGAVSQRGPLMYYSYELIAWIGGWDSLVNIRLWALAFCLAQLVLTWWTARRLLSPRAAVGATLVTGYALTNGIPTFDRFALNGELLQSPFLLGAIALAALALRGRSGRPSSKRLVVLFVSGVLLGAAVSVKQSAALHVVPIALWVVADALRTRERRRAIAELASVAVGLALLPAIFLVHAWLDGSLDAMIYYTATYNVAVHMKAVGGFWGFVGPMCFELRNSVGYGLSLAALVLLAIPPVGRRLKRAWQRRSLRALIRGFGTAEYLALQLVIAVGSAATMRRFFPHYFIPSIPLIGIVLGRALDRGLQRTDATTKSLVLMGSTVTLVLLTAAEVFALERIDGNVAHDKLTRRVARYVEATTQPSDRVFVWGFSPWIYSYSHRRPAGRFLFETYVTGVVPWVHKDLPDEARRVVPGSVELLLGDLERERPALVVDAGTVMLARSLRSYPPFASWLERNYCFEVRSRGFDIYRRKTEAGCKPDAFPQLPRATDFYGRVMDVPVPAPVAGERIVWLYSVDDLIPAWPAGAPRPPKVELLEDPVDVKAGKRLDPSTTPGAVP